MNMSSRHFWDDGGGPGRQRGVNFHEWDEAQDTGQGMCPRDSTQPALSEDVWFREEARIGRLQVSFKRAGFLIW